MSFTCFTYLPKKIRYQIWEYAIQDHLNILGSCIRTSPYDTDLNEIFDHPLTHIIFFRAIPVPELKDDDQRKQFIKRQGAIRECKSTHSVTLSAGGHESQRKKVPSWSTGNPTLFRAGTKFWRISQEALKIWNRYIKRNLMPLYGRMPLSIQVGKYKVKLLINQGFDLVCIRPDMNKKWSYDTNFADIFKILSPTGNETTHLAFEYEPDLNGRSFQAKIPPALPKVPGQELRWKTWFEFFAGKILHAFCHGRKPVTAFLTGNEPREYIHSRLEDPDRGTFYLVNNSQITQFYKDKVNDVYLLAKGKAYRVQGEDMPPLDLIRQAALEEEFGPASEWPKKGIKPILACRLLMLWPTREIATSKIHHRKETDNFVRKRRWFLYPENTLPDFPVDM